ncbi:unnamed protein product [Pelagomonas calceolata]|uniref:Uncharacterized protein n=1 Tax=Pelagomonas calceolata TaxID=35677 RepID=A0A8J2X2F1_9STRA|nr:unnamed protein product [Pelagomonas calceolata]|mmetsp:Transcript_20642/g.58404  ORF Transcript_20642/g.58404 Transcript_20642/m.58404 type:complete len:271 (+) Transcript_20642:222-1034(+)
MASYTQVTPEEEVAGLMSASERRRRFIAAEAEKENAIKARAVNALAEDEALAARLQDAENSAASEPVAFNAHSDTLTEEALARLAAEDKSAQDAALARRLSGADDPDAALARRLQAAEVVPTAAAVEVDPALVRQVAGRIERLTVSHQERERADAALALRLQNAELTQGSAVPEEKDDDAAMAARLQRDEAIAYRDARRRLDAWTPGETRTPVARPARSRAAVRADIASIYAVHNPEKLDNIDAFLDEAGPGNEEVLLEAIQDKYGVPRS